MLRYRLPFCASTWKEQRHWLFIWLYDCVRRGLLGVLWKLKVIIKNGSLLIRLPIWCILKFMNIGFVNVSLWRIIETFGRIPCLLSFDLVHFADPPFTPRDTLRAWQEKNHPWLELSDVHKETTEDIRVTVIPFYMGARVRMPLGDFNLSKPLMKIWLIDLHCLHPRSSAPRSSVPRISASRSSAHKYVELSV